MTRVNVPETIFMLVPEVGDRAAVVTMLCQKSCVRTGARRLSCQRLYLT